MTSPSYNKFLSDKNLFLVDMLWSRDHYKVDIHAGKDVLFLTSVSRAVLYIFLENINIPIASAQNRTPAVQSLACQYDVLARSVLCPPPGTRTYLVSHLDSVITTGHVALPVPNTSACKIFSARTNYVSSAKR
jgi:hypothetical protein